MLFEIAMVLVVFGACRRDPMAPGMGLKAGPGSPECRRAIYHITHPGEDAYEIWWRDYEREVVQRCVHGEQDERDGTQSSDPKQHAGSRAL